MSGKHPFHKETHKKYDDALVSCSCYSASLVSVDVEDDAPCERRGYVVLGFPDGVGPLDAGRFED